MVDTTHEYPNLLIVVGASAGGLEEIVKLVHALPEYLQATVVYACHRTPDAPNTLHAILARHTDLEVRQPVEGEALYCTTIYTGKPRESIKVEGRYFHTEEDVSLLARLRRIDDLFKSAAESAGENCVGVILTGALDDGVEGLKTIKEVGGYCIVQSPSDAQFESMPRNALAEVDVDYVGTTLEIADRLIRLAKGRVCT